jgi:hypothetical protein
VQNQRVNEKRLNIVARLNKISGVKGHNCTDSGGHCGGGVQLLCCDSGGFFAQCQHTGGGFACFKNQRGGFVIPCADNGGYSGGGFVHSVFDSGHLEVLK